MKELKELTEVTADAAEHIETVRANQRETMTVDVEDEMTERFLMTFFPDEHEEYFS